MWDAWSHGCCSSFLNTFPWKEPSHARTPSCPQPFGSTALWTLLCQHSQAVPAQITAIGSNGKTCPDVRRVQRVAALWHVKPRCPSSMELRQGRRRRAWMGLPRPAPVWFPSLPLWRAARQAHPSLSPLPEVVCIIPRFEGRDGWSVSVMLRAAGRHQHTHGQSRLEYRVIHVIRSASWPFPCPDPQPGPFPGDGDALLHSAGIMAGLTQPAAQLLTREC